MKRKILIVEDNISLSQMQKDWFAQAGYDAVTAMNEPVARSLIRKITFDLILSDVRLPEGDGISLLEWLRKEKRDIPFIITTEYVSVSDVVRTIKLGAIDYLPKPVHREHLLELAEDVFRPMVTEEGEGAVSPDKSENRTGGKIRPAGGSFGNGCNDTWRQRNRQGIGGTEYPSGQRTVEQTLCGCKLRSIAPRTGGFASLRT